MFAVVIDEAVLRDVEKGERGVDGDIGVHATGLGLRGMRGKEENGFSTETGEA